MEFTDEYVTTWNIGPSGDGAVEDILELHLKALSATSTVLSVACKAPSAVMHLN